MLIKKRVYHSNTTGIHNLWLYMKKNLRSVKIKILADAGFKIPPVKIFDIFLDYVNYKKSVIN